MTETLEIEARTVEEATQQALEILGIAREYVKVTVLREGKPGIMGFGIEDAKIKVEKLPLISEEENAVTEIVKGILDTLLRMMGLADATVSRAPSIVGGGEKEDVSIVFNIEGDDLGILIGRRGQTLSSLQYIVRLIVGNRTKDWLPIVIDVEGYKQRRYEALRTLAQNIAEQVKTRMAPFTLEPMSPYDRRIIHISLASDPDVTTESVGVGEARKVVITPRKRQRANGVSNHLGR